MEKIDNIRKKYNKYYDIKLEKFKKNAFEIIEYKDKIIRMLCAILEVQGVTTVNIKEFVSSTTYQIKDHLLENSEYELKSNKKKTSSRKRTLINIPEFKKSKRNKELNIFSTPIKKDEQSYKDNNLSDSVLSSYKLSLNDKTSENKIVENINSRSLFVREIDIEQDRVQSETEQDSFSSSDHINNGEYDQNYIESHKKSVENAKNPELKFEDGYKTSVRKEVNNSKILSKNKDIYTEECQLCLMPNTESLHGNFPPVFYKLSCDHIFHLMCVYETVIRRECRKTCCICHAELSEGDKSEIINKVKHEKKENDKKSKLLFKAMKLQEESKD
ncbi:conserved Plasmodium protein, unknown function [Plasmodium berghei]|uniref:RING-type domain-containing protein n=2 Tax=Plasmodium berghei TaxID=5821 RepID=A0A509AT21_PLABA|nr:conserved Plasmodium protein, unknown function [Plasmodium berghei ANKA]CXJ03825.1 conserved Plasmodium protein, unknown function [Plasmodium berghei]SCL98553.1 conserved Plasmodium protein, unknown function [Plasmodium berghei]SCM16852.1 conserved Plasmodium protein, unknown function [Plasmodium berghei]SCM18650.1 conserved Plasmodium protein, unknown function [Plasmodium berghei]SCN28085.1 conserved Plasmodium protein, unknown function [Plasmodium berghei]|eukprot:XP_034423735.1 conserved Plasmodium protein, unknown function [Plasmodium berghei ANKA]